MHHNTKPAPSYSCLDYSTKVTCYNCGMRGIFQRLSNVLKQPTVWRPCVAYFMIALIFFGGFARLSFATDTYADIYMPAREILSNFLQSGRFVTAACFVVFRGLHIDINIVYGISFWVAILALTASLYLLFRLIKKHLVPNRTWAFYLALLVILNPFIIELFLYIEAGVMLLGILACVLASYSLAEYLDSHSSKYLWWAVGLCILATFCYQGILGLFILLAVIIALIKSKTWLTRIKSISLSVGLYVVGPLLNIAISKLLFSGGRIGGEINLGESIQHIVDGSRNMLALFGLVPGWAFWGLIIAALLLWLGYRITQRPVWQRATFFTLFACGFTVVVAVLAALAPQIVQATSSIWVVSRSTYAFASLAGAVLLVIIASDHELLKRRNLSHVLLVFVLGFLVVMFYGFNRVMHDHYASLAFDRNRANLIESAITSYETEHGVAVQTIMASPDQNWAYSYPGVFSIGDINLTAFSTPWSDVYSINYWSQRQFSRQPATPEWQQYCSNHDWQSTDGDQLYFDGTTLKICWY